VLAILERGNSEGLSAYPQVILGSISHGSIMHPDLKQTVLDFTVYMRCGCFAQFTN